MPSNFIIEVSGRGAITSNHQQRGMQQVRQLEQQISDLERHLRNPPLRVGVKLDAAQPQLGETLQLRTLKGSKVRKVLVEQVLGASRNTVYRVTDANESFVLKTYRYSTPEEFEAAKLAAEDEINIVALIEKRQGEDATFCEQNAICPRFVGKISTARAKFVYIIFEWENTEPLVEFCIETLWPIANSDLDAYERTVATLAQQLFTALAAMHAANVVHCDLKPENVVVSISENARYTLRLIDFDLAISYTDHGIFPRDTATEKSRRHYRSTQFYQDPISFHPGDPPARFARKFPGEVGEILRDSVVGDHLFRKWSHRASRYTHFRHFDMYGAACVVTFLASHNAVPLFVDPELRLVGLALLAGPFRRPRASEAPSADALYNALRKLGDDAGSAILRARPVVLEDQTELSAAARRYLSNAISSPKLRDRIRLISRQVSPSRSLQSLLQIARRRRAMPIFDRIMTRCASPNLAIRISALDAALVIQRYLDDPNP